MAVLYDEHPVFQFFPFAQEAGERDAITGSSFWFVEVTEGYQGWQHICAVRGIGYIAGVAQLAFGPANKKRNAMTAFIEGGLFSAHAGVVHGFSVCRPIIGHKKQNGVVAQSGFSEKGVEFAHVVVDIGDHAVKAGDIISDVVEIGLTVFVGDPQRGMGCVGGDVRKKWRIVLFLDPTHGFVKPHVCAISFKSLNYSIVPIVVVKIIIPKIIRSGCNAPGGMVNCFVKSPVLWTVGIIVAEVPFAKMSRAVAIHGENIRQGRQFGIHQ